MSEREEMTAIVSGLARLEGHTQSFQEEMSRRFDELRETMIAHALSDTNLFERVNTRLLDLDRQSSHYSGRFWALGVVSSFLGALAGFLIGPLGRWK